MNTEAVIAFLKEEIALAINQSPDSVDDDLNFFSLGISSIETLKIINRIQKKLTIEINPIAMFEYKTISDFAQYLSNSMLEADGCLV